MVSFMVEYRMIIANIICAMVKELKFLEMCLKKKGSPGQSDKCKSKSSRISACCL